jgi:hypothetical protein
MTPTPLDFDLPDLDPNRLAAVIYRAEDGVDTLLADFAAERLRAGERLGGIVQRNVKDANGNKIDMQARSCRGDAAAPHRSAGAAAAENPDRRPNAEISGAPRFSHHCRGDPIRLHLRSAITGAGAGLYLI